jgi:phosphoglycolate phosphatase-like HAD superfamily hydrolase
MRSAFATRRLSADARAALLRELISRAQIQTKAGRRPSVVFDLDGTLLDNRPRVAVILKELAEHWRDRFPEAAERVAAVRVENIVYDTTANLELLGVHDAALHEAGRNFWKERFFTDGYIGHDAPLPGSVDFVRQVYDMGANVVYLTGRDLPKMALGTFASLRDRGFPIGRVGTELVTKPNFETPDAEFKREVAGSLRRTGDVLAVFDNEPANCNLLQEAHPDCVAVFVDSHHAPNPPPLHETVHVIDTFDML